MFRYIMEGRWDKRSYIMKYMKWFWEVENYDRKQNEIIK
jgi:hypothetical protein